MEEKLNSKKISEIRNLINENFAQTPTSKDRFHKEDPEHLGYDYEKNFSIRDEFTRDSDRILYSKAFRRLEHKAQVYSNKKGDHYRTRLTHTLEVTQIARSISRNLGLNEHLTEAIALGHDIGHTPFGHAGEEILDGIMRGKDDLGGKINFSIDYGGFKHNFNCLKILEIVEKRKEKTGLNLTWQTLDGILKHTRILKENKKWDLNRFVRDISYYEPFIKYEYFGDDPNYTYPLTLEGQVVAISDEIAQREHDLDDSLRDKDLFRFEDMFKIIKEIICNVEKDIDSKMSGYGLFGLFKQKILNLERIENRKQWRELTSIIISYFIIDVTENTMKIINESTIDEMIFIKDNKKYIKKDIVFFSEIGKKINDQIDEFIEKRIINSFNVNRFDGKGKFILRQLVKAYYENPRQMPRKQLLILVKNIKEIIKEYPQLKSSISEISINLKELLYINEKNIDFDNLEPLLEILKFDKKKLDYEKFYYEIEPNKDPTKYIDNILEIIDYNINQKNKENYTKNEIINGFYESLFNFCNINSISEIKKSYKEYENFLLLIKGWNELHYVYLSTICDYISQMTDDYAIKEYHELYLN